MVVSLSECLRAAQDGDCSSGLQDHRQGPREVTRRLTYVYSTPAGRGGSIQGEMLSVCTSDAVHFNTFTTQQFVKALCFPGCPSTAFVCLSRQILLLRYLMISLSDLDATYKG